MIDWNKPLRTKKDKLPVTLLTDKVRFSNRLHWTRLCLIEMIDGTTDTAYYTDEGMCPHLPNSDLENVPDEFTLYLVYGRDEKDMNSLAYAAFQKLHNAETFQISYHGSKIQEIKCSL